MSELFREVPGAGLDIGFVGAELGAEGPRAVAASELVRWFRSRGHRVHSLELEHPSGAGTAPVHSVRTEHLADPGVALRRVVPAERSSWELAPAVDRIVLAWLAETPCDVVHVHGLAGLGIGVLHAVADVGQPLVASVDADWPRSPEVVEALGLCQRIFVPPGERASWIAPPAGPARERRSSEPPAGLDPELCVPSTPLSEARTVDFQDLERAYVETIRALTGLEPDLLHPLEGLSAPTPEKPERRPGLLGRLFGR